MAFELMYMGQNLAVLIYSMTIEKGKAQKNKNKAAKMKFSRISRIHAQDLITLGKIVKRFHQLSHVI